MTREELKTVLEEGIAEAEDRQDELQERDSLVDWENPPTVKDLKADLDEARGSHQQHVAKVNEWIDSLRGKLKIKVQDGRSKVQPKLVRKQNEWRYSALEEPFLSTDKMFVVDPVTAMDVDAARQNQLILNKQFRVDINKVKFINKYVRTAVNTGTVIVKLSWETQTGVVTEEVPTMTETPEQLYFALEQMMMQGQIPPEQAQQMMASGEPIQIGTHYEEVEKEIVNRPVLEVKDSRDVIIDPSCEGVIEHAQFIIDRFTSDLSTLKKDGRYSNLDKIPESAYNAFDDYGYRKVEEDVSFRFSDKARKKLTVYEYWGFWDIHNDGTVQPIVASWVGDTMIRLEENPYPDKELPFVVVQYLPPDNDTVYGDADASLLKDNQDIIGAVTRSMVDLIGRSANAQQGVRKDILDPINRDRFNKGLDFEFNPVGNLQDGIYMTKLPEIPQSAMEVIGLQNSEAEALTGVKSFSQGITSESLGNVASGIRSAMDATAKRELGILRRLSDGIKQIGRKIMAMNSVWLSDEEVIRITDDEFVSISRASLAGNFDLSINVSTAEVDNQKAEELAFMLQTTGNTLPFDITKIILCKIAELRKLPDLARMIMDYTPQPDPLMQQKAQLECQLLEAQIANEQAKAYENEADINLKRAKTDSERAKSRKTASEADRIDLDYVNEATGVNRANQLQDKQMDAQNAQEQTMLKGHYDLRKQSQKPSQSK